MAINAEEFIEEVPTISHETAVTFVKQHPAEASYEEDKALFYEAMGMKKRYSTAEVLGWLGY